MTASGQEEGTGALFFDISLLFLQGNRERVFSRTLVAELNGLGDRPWAGMRQGKEITELWLARQLRPYGVRPKTMWIGKSVAKGYLKNDFEEIFHRYIPKAQAQALLDELKVSIQPPKAEEDSVGSQGQNGAAGKENAEAGEDCGAAE